MSETDAENSNTGSGGTTGSETGPTTGAGGTTGSEDTATGGAPAPNEGDAADLASGSGSEDAGRDL